MNAQLLTKKAFIYIKTVNPHIYVNTRVKILIFMIFQFQLIRL